MFHGLYRVSKDQGSKGLSSGGMITMLKEGSNHAIRFPLFMGMQKLFSPYFNNHVLRDLVTGTMTGFLCVMINQPLDVVKTNLQGLNSHQYKGTTDCFNQILRKEGFFGLYKGLRPRMVRCGIEVAVTFASYNVIKDAVLGYLETAD